MDNPIITLIPEELRDDWDPDEPLPKPDIKLHLEWVYGYHGHTGGQFNNASNILFLQNVSILNYELFIFFIVLRSKCKFAITILKNELKEQYFQTTFVES